VAAIDALTRATRLNIADAQLLADRDKGTGMSDVPAAL
jgi:hypothetical protein